MIIFLYHLVYILPLCLAGTFLGLHYLEQQALYAGNGAFPALISAAVCILCSLAIRLKKGGKFVLGLCASSVAAGLCFLWDRGNLGDNPEQYLWIALVMVQSFACFLIGQVIVKARVLKLGMAFAIVLSFVLCVFFRRHMDSREVALFVFLLLVVLADFIQSGWKKAGFAEGNAHLVFISPFLLLVLISLWLIPAPSVPYGWPISKAIWNTAKERVTNLADYLSWRFSSFSGGGTAGFSDRSIFLGEVKSNDEVMMEVSATFSQDVYLVGKIYDTFDGKEWKQKDTSDEKDRMLDTMESYISAYTCDHQVAYPADLIHMGGITVQYEKVKTKYLFVPAKALLNENFQGERDFSMTGDNLLLEGDDVYQAQYSISYYNVNRNHPIFADFIEQATPVTKEDWKSQLYKFHVAAFGGCLYEDWEKHRQEIKDVFTEKIDLSPDVKTCMDRVYEGAGTDFAKMERLEAYLSSFEYTTQVENYPKHIQSSSEYLDYFLLEQKKGYCNYFATAFVLLARAEGMPARYVQGFRIPKGKVTSGYVDVTGNQGHAWAEVYFDGFGWVQFDPTPGYGDTSFWLSTEENRAFYEANMAQNSQNHEMEPAFPEDTAPEMEVVAEDPVDEDALAAMEEEELLKKQLRIKVLAACVLFSLFVLGASFAAARIWSAKRYQKMDDRDKIPVMCKRLLALLAEMGYEQADGQTLQEFRIQLSGEEAFGDGDLDFIDAYERYLYADLPATKDQRMQVENNFIAVREKYKEINRVRYWLYRLKGK